MDNVFPIYVASKGRPQGSTIKQLLSSNLNWRVVVEPQDAESYSDFMPVGRIVKLPENDKGIAYVRNYILENADTLFGWYWMIDDDVSSFYKVQNKKCIKVKIDDCLIGAQRLFFGENNLGQASIEYQQFAWCATSAIKFNGYCDVVVCINKKNTGGAKYRGIVNLKEDRDFTLQLLSSGKNTARVSRFAFSAPKNGSNAGGLQNLYKSGKEAGACKTMVSIWGENICRHIIKPDGRNDVSINWKAFKR